MSQWEENLRTLASMYGIATEYWDIQGRKIQVPRGTLVALLSAMGVDGFSQEELQEALAQARRRRKALLNSFIHVTRKRTKKIRIPPGFEKGEIVVLDEGEQTVFCSPFSYPQVEVVLPEGCSWGYFTILFHSEKGGELSALLVFSPLQAYLPSEKVWGIHGALSSLNTGGERGIGDFKDLENLQNLVLAHGGRFLGLLPLHLTAKGTPEGVSPYLSLSRLLFDPIYLSPEDVLSLFPVASLSPTPGPGLCEDYIDYEQTWQKKDCFLRRIFRVFWDGRYTAFTRLWEEFQGFMEKERDRVLQASLYQAIAEQEGLDWRKWPLPLRRRNEEALQAFSKIHEYDILYFSFLQWLVHQFLEKITSKNRILCFDLPAGCAPFGIESWLSQDKLIFKCTVGAPPDDFSPEGQNWGFHPFSPWKMKENYYADFVALLRYNMRFARFLRLDHIMGLKRLFWIPEGEKPSAGTYVEYPFRDLLAILTLESVKNRVTLIGEDLGTVPRFLRSALRKSSILSTRVFYFEREGYSPRHPQSYPPQSYATLNTHDMPPLQAFIKGKDIALRESLGIFTPEQVLSFLEDRRQFMEELLKKLREWQFLPEEVATSFHLLLALCRFLATVPSLVVSVSLDDLLESEVQINLPGTVNEYPNWRHRLFVDWEDFEKRLSQIAPLFTPPQKGEKLHVFDECL